MHRRTLFLLTLLLVILGAAGCSDAPATSQELDVVSPSAQLTQTTASTKSLPEINLVDALGNEISFPSPPRRVAIAGKASQILIHAAYTFPEAVDRIVGMEQRLQRKLSMLELVDPSLHEKTQFERNAAAEQIAPVQPEAVLLKSYMAERLGQPLDQLNIPVIYLDLETPEQFFRDLDTLGMLFGNQERAEEVKAFYQQRLDTLTNALSDLEVIERPRVLLIQYSDKGGEVAFMIPPATWLQTTMVEQAGGEAVWTEASETGGWKVVNFEQIAAWDPDQIFVVYYPGDSQSILEDLRQDPKWQALQAVTQDQIFAFPGDFLSWDQPDTRWILGLEWLATKIQPKRITSLDILTETKQFYLELYGVDEVTFEEEILPLITGDLGS
jgi:iron complex transport system substrate-binding protein